MRINASMVLIISVVRAGFINRVARKKERGWYYGAEKGRHEVH